MARRRYIYDQKTGEMAEVTLDYAPPRPDQANYHIMGDKHYGNLRASDGVDISTRTKHREYMKQRGLSLAADYPETWKKAAEKRAEYFKGIDPTRRAEVARALFNEVHKRRK